MAVPTFFHTWQFKVNNVVAVAGSLLIQCQQVIFGFHQAMLGTGGGFTNAAGNVITPTGNWGVAGSSDSVTAGMDGVDRWPLSTNLVWAAAGNAHSWMVYDLPFGGQICVDLSNVNASSLTLVYSAGGLFTGGTTTARPTAIDQDILINNAAWGKSTNVLSTWHVLRTTTGDVTFIQCANGWANFIWDFQNAHNPVTGWTPFVAGVVGTSAGAPVSTAFTLAAMFNTTWLHARGNGNFLMFPGVEGNNTTRVPFIVAFANQANQLSGEFGIFPWGLVSQTALNLGRMGQLPDVWAGCTGLTDGNWYGNTPTDRALVQWGLLVTPWNQSVPNLAGGAPAYIGIPAVQGLQPQAPAGGGGGGAVSQLLQPNNPPYQLG